mmetsp:Transcript_60830/g.128730  ORF Transcript_60830/g.128730 Transcript_60830/m.128730 type:complete len:87 (-) Transcript_60830:246-506(-)
MVTNSRELMVPRMIVQFTIFVECMAGGAEVKTRTIVAPPHPSSNGWSFLAVRTLALVHLCFAIGVIAIEADELVKLHDVESAGRPI